MGRSPCCEKAHTNKGAWTKEEDILLASYISAHGEGCWRSLPKAAGLQRCGKSCRLRWINYLRPDLKRGNFTEEEDETIIRLHRQLGNKWSLIASHLSGRTDNEIKNYWNTHIKRKVASRGPSELQGMACRTAANAADRVSSASSSSATQADQPVDILQAAVAVPHSPTSMGNPASTAAAEGLDLELSIGLPCWDSHAPTTLVRRKAEEEEEKVVVSPCVSMLIGMR